MKTNHDNLAEQKLEKPSHIQDENLAWDMAHAQAPHIESAQLAMKQGNFAETAGHLAAAEASSRQAAEGFIDEQQVKLDELRHQVGATSNKHEKETNFETKVANAKKDLAERYNVPAEDFSLVTYETEDGETEYRVMHTALKGIDLGDPAKTYDSKRSYDSIMADDNSHIFEIDGNQIDDRGLTEGDYNAFIEQAIAQNKGGSFTPDTETVTLLTGEVAIVGGARGGGVGDGRPDVYWILRDDGFRNVRFRPVVKITKD